MTAQETRDELRRHYLATREVLLAAISGLTDAQMEDASIDGWSPKDHLAHLSMWDEIRTLEIERISAGGSPAWPLMTDEQIERFNGLIADVRRGLSAAEVLRGLEFSRASVLAAVAAATERGLDESLYGEAGLRSTHEVGHAEAIRAWRDGKGF